MFKDLVFGLVLGVMVILFWPTLASLEYSGADAQHLHPADLPQFLQIRRVRVADLQGYQPMRLCPGCNCRVHNYRSCPWIGCRRLCQGLLQPRENSFKSKRCNAPASPAAAKISINTSDPRASIGITSSSGV